MTIPGREDSLLGSRWSEVPVWQHAPSGGRQTVDRVVEEEPLRIRVSGRDLGVLMRTPGDDEALALGFVLGEGVVASPDEVDRVRLCPASGDDGAVADVELLDPEELDLSTSLRTGLVTSGCGVCGREVIERVLERQPPQGPPFTLDAASLATLADLLRARQPIFESTGGCHGAALFDAAGTLLYAAEDVGRHNAVDKALGHAALAGAWPVAPILVTSSRGSYDILQKAVVAGVRLVATVSAPSAMAVRLATAAHITLVGFLRQDRFAVYAGRGRVRFPAEP